MHLGPGTMPAVAVPYAAASGAGLGQSPYSRSIRKNTWSTIASGPAPAALFVDERVDRAKRQVPAWTPPASCTGRACFTWNRAVSRLIGHTLAARSTRDQSVDPIPVGPFAPHHRGHAPPFHAPPLPCTARRCRLRLLLQCHPHRDPRSPSGLHRPPPRPQTGTTYSAARPTNRLKEAGQCRLIRARRNAWRPDANPNAPAAAGPDQQAWAITPYISAGRTSPKRLCGCRDPSSTAGTPP